MEVTIHEGKLAISRLTGKKRADHESRKYPLPPSNTAPVYNCHRLLSRHITLFIQHVAFFAWGQMYISYCISDNVSDSVFARIKMPRNELQFWCHGRLVCSFFRRSVLTVCVTIYFPTEVLCFRLKFILL